MTNQTDTQTHMLQLLVTGDLVPVRESEQQAAAKAFFRGRLLGDMLEIHDDSTHCADVGTAASGHQKF